MMKLNATNDKSSLMRVCHPLRAVELVLPRWRRRQHRGPSVAAAAGVELVGHDLWGVVAAAGAHALRLRRGVGVEGLPDRGMLLLGKSDNCMLYGLRWKITYSQICLVVQCLNQ